MKSAMPKSKAKTAYGLLSEVRKLILEEPKRYSQRLYIARTNEDPEFEFPACGTIGCVAGWVATLTEGRFGYLETCRVAMGALGIDIEQAAELFDADAASGPSQSLEHARTGAKHIARFQQKYAKQLKAKKI